MISPTVLEDGGCIAYLASLVYSAAMRERTVLQIPRQTKGLEIAYSTAGVSVIHFCRPGIRCQSLMRTVAMKDSHLLEIQDEWCREMVRQASSNVEEIDVRITAARKRRFSSPPPHNVHALDREIAILQRIREELESDIQNWIGN